MCSYTAVVVSTMLAFILIYIRKSLEIILDVRKKDTFQDPSANFRFDQIREVVKSGLFTCTMQWRPFGILVCPLHQKKTHAVRGGKLQLVGKKKIEKA